MDSCRRESTAKNAMSSFGLHPTYKERQFMHLFDFYINLLSTSQPNGLLRNCTSLTYLDQRENGYDYTPC